MEITEKREAQRKKAREKEKNGRGTVLFVGSCRERQTGNATTLARLRSHVESDGWHCILVDPRDVCGATVSSSARVSCGATVSCGASATIAVGGNVREKNDVARQERGHEQKDVVEAVEEGVVEAMAKMLREEGIVMAIGIHFYRSAQVLLACKALGVPFVAVCGGTDLNVCVNEPYKLALMTRVVFASAHLMTFTHHLRDTLLATWPHVDPDRVTVLPPAIAVTPSDSFSVQAFLTALDVAHQEGKIEDQTDGVDGCDGGEPSDGDTVMPDPLLVLVAGLRPVKDVMYVMEAWGAWNEGGGGRGRLVVLGPPLDPYYADAVHRAAQRCPGVRVCHGLPPSECHALMRAATAVINTSTSEGMSNALLEAMLLGTPVIARDIPGNRNVVDDGVSGLLFSSCDDFIHQLTRLVSCPDLAKALTTAATTYVTTHHDHHAEARDLLAVIERLVGM